MLVSARQISPWPDHSRTVCKYVTADCGTVHLTESAVADIEDWSPPHWPEVLENIRAMRDGRDAPVDSMGAEVFMADPGSVNPKVKQQGPLMSVCLSVCLYVLVSLILSSQTRDEVTL